MPRSSKPPPAPAVTLDTVGGLLGPRLATVITDAMTAHAHQLTDHKVTVLAKGIEQFVDLVGAELQPFLAPILRDLAAHPDLSPHVSNLLGFTADHHGEAASIIRGVAAAQAITPGIGTLIGAELAPAVQNLLRVVTTALLDPASLAQLVVRQIRPLEDARVDAAKQNIPGTVFDWMVDLARTMPDPATLFELTNRGLITEDTLHTYLFRGGQLPGFSELLAQLRHVKLSPADLADMVVRNIKTHDEATIEAGASGVSPADFAALVLDTGEPLALEQLLLLYRRGKIDRAQLEHGIRQSRVRDEWIGPAIDLQHAPAAGAEVIRAAVQGHLGDAEARRLFDVAGQDPSTYDWQLATAGRPPGVQELIALLRRGVIGPDVVAQAVRESDIKDKYIPDILKMAVYQPPPRTVVALVHAGVLDDAEALRLLQQEGLAEHLAVAYVREAHHTRTAAAHELAKTTILQLFHDRAIDDAQALTMLEGIGWKDHDARFLLEVEQLRREAGYVERAIAHVHTLYVGYRLDRPQLLSALTSLEVPQSQQQHLVKLWDLEREAARKTLTHANISAAFKDGLLDQGAATTELERMGYTAFDSWLLLSLAVKQPLPDRPAGP